MNSAERSTHPHNAALSKRLRYQEQDAPMTLREGLDEYIEVNPNLYDPDQVSVEGLGEYLTNHDVSHVVFGTQTTLEDEFIQDVWTFIAMDISAKAYITEFIATEESKQILRALTVRGVLAASGRLLWSLPTMLRRAWRMPKKWPWRGWEVHLDRPLSELRQEFNIRVL